MSAHLKPTVLLTGATGLVGRYLMAGFLDRGFELAVLARENSLACARQRVEAAAASMEQFYALPRPKVLSGCLDEPDLRLSIEDQTWLRNRELVVVHCAASIKFHQDQSGEPYKTNLTGTKNLLDFCKGQRISQFHYVSTAYVGCRTRDSKVFEVPATLNDGQGNGKVDDSELVHNDYELSKIQSEAMISEAGWLGRRIIHRPSIVVGDSRTGYSSTFHGFYAPLKIGAQYASAFGFSSQAGDWFRDQLGLSQHDQKNLVHVDWVASGIVKGVMTSEIPDGTILHWTNPSPVSCIDMQSAIVETIQARFQTRATRSDGSIEHSHDSSASPSALPTASDFRSSLGAYASYFKSDPYFDNSNTRRYLPELQCPRVDLRSLKQLAEYAFDNDFGWPRPQPAELPGIEVFNFFQALPEREFTANTSKTIALQTTGRGAMQRMVLAEDGSEWIRCINLPEGSEVSLTLKFADFLRCILGVTDITQLTRNGRALIQAVDQTDANNLIAILILHVKSSIRSHAR